MNGPHIVCPRGEPPWGNLYLTLHIIFVCIISSIINHHSSLINHQSSIISHQSSVINHQSSMINDQSSVFNHHTIWVPGILGPRALGSQGPEPWDPGARSPGIPGPGALGSWSPGDPGARSPGIPGPGAQNPGIPGQPWDPCGPSVTVGNCWKPSF